jgi:hypothetical protein
LKRDANEKRESLIGPPVTVTVTVAVAGARAARGAPAECVDEDVPG